jgi:hypothetical protein
MFIIDSIPSLCEDSSKIKDSSHFKRVMTQLKILTEQTENLIIQTPRMSSQEFSVENTLQNLKTISNSFVGKYRIDKMRVTDTIGENRYKIEFVLYCEMMTQTSFSPSFPVSKDEFIWVEDDRNLENFEETELKSIIMGKSEWMEIQHEYGDK